MNLLPLRLLGAFWSISGCFCSFNISAMRSLLSSLFSSRIFLLAFSSKAFWLALLVYPPLGDILHHIQDGTFWIVLTLKGFVVFCMNRATAGSLRELHQQSSMTLETHYSRGAKAEHRKNIYKETKGT